MTTVVWAKYDPVINLMTTELDGLANGAATAPGASQVNLGGRFYGDIEFAASTPFSPQAGGYIEIWLLRSIDGGVAYEDGSAAAPPTRAADIAIMIRSGTSIQPRCGGGPLELPPGFYRVLARNMTGVALPPSGSIIRMAAYSESV